ncbi:MAG: SAM-dependent chlorinase/fluorinase, partial [Bacteroidetes bacterium]|nr:SAM-dependent chlorinase/fluorinase [Bacteroidota bacterium]
IDPEIRIIDITHEIEPQNIDEAAFVLWYVYSNFPKKTVFVSVVDPGVGSKRNILCVETNNHYFLAPDNGLLKVIHFTEEIYLLLWLHGLQKG